jgi:hypothetical protein
MVNVAKGRNAKTRRQEAAKVREENKRSPKAQLAHLDREGHRAIKERKRLSEQI